VDDFDKIEHPELKKPLMICNDCGNTQLLTEAGEEEKARKFYETEYRSDVGLMNLQTTSRKLGYILAFLKDWIDTIPKDKVMNVADIGCATGYLLNWFRLQGHRVCGSEWTLLMRRFSENFYGVPVYRDIPEPKDEEHKFDLITLYHVFEHLHEPDEKLKKYVSWLKPEGKIMIATPEWFDALELSAVPYHMSLYEYFHENHINVFSFKMLNNMFKKCGLKVLKVSRETYGQCFLLEKAPNVKFEIEKEDKQFIKDYFSNADKALQAFHKKQHREAVTHMKKFPVCYVNWVEATSMKKDPDRAIDVWKEGLEACPSSPFLLSRYCFWLYQNQRWEELIEQATKAISMKPAEDVYSLRASAYFTLGKYREAMMDYQTVINMNPATWSQNVAFICKSATSMPNWEEVAEKEIKEQLFQNAKPKMELKVKE
jgi:2-polyprenyl-3-methyl-5-hydroxy-6-metoxy-1,4-benzoquinol methylase